MSAVTPDDRAQYSGDGVVRPYGVTGQASLGHDENPIFSFFTRISLGVNGVRIWEEPNPVSHSGGIRHAPYSAQWENSDVIPLSKFLTMAILL